MTLKQTICLIHMCGVIYMIMPMQVQAVCDMSYDSFIRDTNNPRTTLLIHVRDTCMLMPLQVQAVCDINYDSFILDITDPRTI